MYQRTVDYPDEWNNGFHVWLDIEELEGCGGSRWKGLGASHVLHRRGNISGGSPLGCE